MKVTDSHIASTALFGPNINKTMIQEMAANNLQQRAERIATFVENYVTLGGNKVSLPLNSANPNERDEAQLAEAISKEILGEKPVKKEPNGLATIGLSMLAPGSISKQTIDTGLQTAANDRAERMVDMMRNNNYPEQTLNPNKNYEGQLAKALKTSLDERNISTQNKWVSMIQDSPASQNFSRSR